MQPNVRETILSVVHEFSSQEGNFQAGVILNEVRSRLNPRTVDEQQAALTVWHDLLRTGILAPGFDFSNANLPFIHLTEKGRKALEHLSRDPSNPDGYLHHLRSAGLDDDIAMSYITEALASYNSACYKSAAVMAGCAVERLVVIVRDELVAGMARVAVAPPAKLSDWKFKTIRDAIFHVLESRRADMPAKLKDSFAAFWIPFTEQARLTRNDAGHPTSVQPVAADTVHGNLLLLPQNVALVTALLEWIKGTY